MKLSIGYFTARKNPELDWFIKSLESQIRPTDEIELIEVNALCSNTFKGYKHTVTPPMPNVWQGEHRVTKDQWWNVCCARNTFLCLAKHDWILMLDDRCVLMPGFLDAVREAQSKRYIMAGAYEKRVGMKVENGVIVHGGTVIGKDTRCEQNLPVHPYPCAGEWLFGCVVSMPLEWALHVNGYSELLCGGMGFEDVIWGRILKNNHYPMMFDKRAMMIEDRTPEELGTPMKRTCKERHPNDEEDKAHKALELSARMRRSENPFGDIKELRNRIQAGHPWPEVKGPKVDWFDGMKISDFDNIP